MTDFVVNARFLTQRVTGVQRYAIEVARRLKRLAPAARFLTPAGVIHPHLATELDAQVVGRLRGHAWEQFELPYHLNGAGLVGLCNAGPLAVRRQMVTLHDAAPFAVPEAFGRAYATWTRFATRVLGQRARRIITVSQFSANELARRAGIPPNKIEVYPEGYEHIVELGRDRGVLERHGLTRRPYLLAVGSRSPHKNFAALLRAARQLENASFLFVIAGGADPRVHAAVSGETLGANVRHVGAVTDAELRALYEEATGYVHPAYYEGFGLPPLEAMALGCPVLTSNAASLPEIMGDAAMYFEPHDYVGMARKIEQFMADTAGRAELARRGLERAQLFSWDRCAVRLLEAANDALGSDRNQER